MHPQLQEILESLILTIDVLNGELMRFARSEQFEGSTSSLRLITDVRDRCLCSLQNVQSIERRLLRQTFFAENPKPEK